MSSTVSSSVRSVNNPIKPKQSQALKTIEIKHQKLSQSNETSAAGGLLFNQKQSAKNVEVSIPGKPVDVSAYYRSSGEEATPETMFEYMMGIKEIELSYEQYSDREAFVTTPIEVIGNVKEIELVTNENHPVFDTVSGKANGRQTSIEYYVTYNDNPTQKDWLPILPKDQKEVLGERLFFNGVQATLRFPAEVQSIKVYRNNLLIDQNEYSIISNSQLAIPYYEPSFIYTVDYVPSTTRTNPRKIELDFYKAAVKQSKEVYEGTAYNKTIQLNHYPYVDYEKINQEELYDPNSSDYRPISVRLINASLAGKGNTRLQVVPPYDGKSEAFTFNRSLYKDKSWSEMKNYELDPANYYGGFDYYQWKNKVVFTETFNAEQIAENHNLTHGVADVEITYDYLVSKFRLKAILRRNTSEETTATPEILQYNLLFKTIK
ncbi:hypothetical protein I4L69_001643 [Enterococcus faecium]|nr:hypothetical protein [Enterococcus faecium]